MARGAVRAIFKEIKMALLKTVGLVLVATPAYLGLASFGAAGALVGACVALALLSLTYYL